jgi:hypothetical protein
MKKVILISIICATASCSAIREKTWPVEMAIFGSVEPFGKKESHQEQLQRVYAEAWNEGFISGHRAAKGGGE